MRGAGSSVPRHPPAPAELGGVSVHLRAAQARRAAGRVSVHPGRGRSPTWSGHRAQSAPCFPNRPAPRFRRSDAMTDLLPTILILGMLATMAAKSLPVVRAPVSGKALVEVPVPLLFRLLGHRANAVAILVVLMLGSGMFGDRWVSHG